MCDNISKCFLFLFNLVILISGLSLVFFGLLMKIDPEMAELQPIMKEYNDHTIAPTLLITLGTLTFFVAFLGCCGILRGNQCMLFTFTVFMAIIFVAELAIGVTALSLDAEDIVVVPLEKTIIKYNLATDNTTQLWDGIQITFDCCGVHNYTDWYPILNNMLPLSCCEANATVKTCDDLSASLQHSSCLAAVSTAMRENSSTIIVYGVIIVAIQVLSMVFSCHLAHLYKSSYSPVAYGIGSY